MTCLSVGGYPYAPSMTATLIGYARCSTDEQDLTAQRQLLLGLASPRIESILTTGLPAPTATARA